MSPYEFSVISVEIIGNAYEQFLGKTITIGKNHSAKIELKPEVRKAGGVYYTPEYIVDYIVANTVGEAINGKKPEEIANIKILDPACGSGSFLLGAYKYLLNYHIEYYNKIKDRAKFKGSKEDVIPDFTHTIKFKIRKSSSESDGTKYCVETYNLCPYNFRILGGTENYSDEFYMRNDSGFEVEKQNDGSYTQKNPSNYDKEFTNKNNCEFDQDGNRHCNGPCFVGDKVYACYNKPSNFCQIDRHCVTIQPLVEEEKRYDSVYIDQACVDNVGSSHNFLNYERQTSYSTSGNTRLLVAPIVECINETFKNILSQCLRISAKSRITK